MLRLPFKSDLAARPRVCWRAATYAPDHLLIAELLHGCFLFHFFYFHLTLLGDLLWGTWNTYGRSKTTLRSPLTSSWAVYTGRYFGFTGIDNQTQLKNTVPCLIYALCVVFMMAFYSNQRGLNFKCTQVYAFLLLWPGTASSQHNTGSEAFFHIR